jgi:universal stress protein E
MYPIRRILVAIKDSRARRSAAITKAAQLALALRAEVCLFHGMAEPVYLDVARIYGESLPELEERSAAQHRKRLERLAALVRRRGVKVTTAVEWDYPAHEAVIRAATRFQADLIIAECHRGTHLAPWLLGFTDWELLRNSPLPVLLIRNHRMYRRSRVLAAIDPTHAYAKPANLDPEILRYAATIAGALRGGLHAVHAYNPLFVGLTPGELVAPNGIAMAQKQAAAHARGVVDPALDSQGIARARRHIVGGLAVDVIQNVARKIHAGMLVMGAISRSGLKSVLIGNTAERLLDRMTCDLLIVKPRHFSSDIARVRRGPQLITAPLMAGGLSAGC